MSNVILRRVAIVSAAVTAALVVVAFQVISVEFVAFTRDGVRTTLGPAPIDTFAPRVSPDGRLIAFTGSGGSLRVVDLANVGEPRRIPALGDAAFLGWDDRGERIFYIAAPGPNQAMFVTRVDGSSYSSMPLRDPARGADSYSSVLGGLTFLTLTGNDYDVWFYSERDQTSTRVATLPGSGQLSGNVSPDGKWIAYKSDETGRFEVWAQRFPSGPRVQLTTDGGNNPVWSRDGREIYFDDGRQLFAIAVRATDVTLAADRPVALPISGFEQAGSLRRQWDLMPDGRFLVLMR